MPAIDMQGLKKAFHERPVLHGVSLTVNQGDIYGFLGPNGSGKTTTLRLLLGILSPDEGRIAVLGMNPAVSGAQLHRRVNALPESHGLYGWMSSLAYLNFFGRLYGLTLSGGDYRARLRQVGLDPDDSRPVRTFSRGMKQRLGIARAMINDPEILFLDEPTNGLDPRGRREIHDLLLQLNREKGLTIMISTHILDDVERLCNRIGILEGGLVRYEGPLTDDSQSAVSYRFHLKDGAAVQSPWNFPGIALLERQDSWITCLIKEGSPAAAIKTLVLGGLPIIEAVAVSGGVEDLYLYYTQGGGL
jgi:ABC-2 type transport system ATP-binding protein